MSRINNLESSKNEVQQELNQYKRKYKVLAKEFKKKDEDFRELQAKFRKVTSHLNPKGKRNENREHHHDIKQWNSDRTK